MSSETRATSKGFSQFMGGNEGKRWGLGILGLGEGRSAISAALQSDFWDLVLLCDVNEEVCKQRSKEFDFHQYTLSYEEMLAHPKIDAIAIYTPDFLHGTHIRMAMEAGKHVLCTKPLLNNFSEALELISLQERTGKKLMVGQSSRFFEPMIKQRNDYESGELGELESVEAYYHADHRWFLSKGWSLEPSFKWLFGGLSHPVDLIRWYMPNIQEVFGYGYLSKNGRAGGLHHEDTMHLVCKAEDGRIARVSGVYSNPIQPVVRDSEMSCILRGTMGCSQADYMDLRYAITNKSGEERLQTWEKKLKHYFRFEGKSHHAGEYQNYLDYFASCLTHQVDPQPSLREGIGTMAVLHAMDLSMKQQKPILVDDVLRSHHLPSLKELR